MYILEAIPIGSGMPTDTLTYYSKDICNVGDIVSINIGKIKDIKALVIDIDSLANRKQDIKDKSWLTKKINSLVKAQAIDPDLLLAIYHSAIEYILPTGILLSMLITKKVWDRIVNIENINEATFTKDKLSDKRQSETTKTLHIVPTQNELRAIKKENNRANNNKQQYSSDTDQHVYSTPSLDYVLTDNIGSIYIHNPDSSYYQHTHHKRNMYRIIESVISHYNINIEQGIAIDTDNINKIKAKQKIKISIVESIYDLSKVNIIRDEFTYITPLISAVTDRLIRNVYANYLESGTGRILIYANRKGESPLSRCYDCGLDMLCPDCNMPLVLHKSTKSERYYQCHHCDYRLTVDKEIACGHCGGWRIMPIGISTGSIESQLRMHYTFIKNEEELTQTINKNEEQLDKTNTSLNKDTSLKLPIYRLDSETANTPNKINRILASWQAHGGILITNDTGINDRSIAELQASYSIIISLDGLYSLPVADIDMRLLHILNRLNEISKASVYVHTHLSHNAIYNIVDNNKDLQKEIKELKSKIGNKLKIAKIYPYYDTIRVLKSKNISDILEVLHRIKNISIYNTVIEWSTVETKGGDDIIIKVLKSKEADMEPLHMSLYQTLIKENIEFNL